MATGETVAAKKPTAILFDFDGVIVDSEALHHRAYEIALAPHGVSSIPLDVYADRFSNRGLGLEYCAQQVRGLDVRELKRRKDRLFQEILEADARLLPGVADVLGALAEGRPLALATGSAREVVTFVLRRFDLLGFFRAVIGREDYDRDKPAPDAFLRACESLGEQPPSCLAVEDSYKGLCAARAAGIPCVVIPNEYTRNGNFAGAAAILSSLCELSAERAEAILDETTSDG
ncbi:MAG TPA: HAD family phosphatase [Candidatus Binatia bacterium]|nr:HAD family phosphatase [Candidatus Binatia bacterium]